MRSSFFTRVGGEGLVISVLLGIGKEVVHLLHGTIEGLIGRLSDIFLQMYEIISSF